MLQRVQKGSGCFKRVLPVSAISEGICASCFVSTRRIQIMVTEEPSKNKWNEFFLSGNKINFIDSLVHGMANAFFRWLIGKWKRRLSSVWKPLENNPRMHKRDRVLDIIFCKSPPFRRQFRSTMSYKTELKLYFCSQQSTANKRPLPQYATGLRRRGN